MAKPSLMLDPFGRYTDPCAGMTTLEAKRLDAGWSESKVNDFRVHRHRPLKYITHRDKKTDFIDREIVLAERWYRHTKKIYRRFKCYKGGNVDYYMEAKLEHLLGKY